MPDNPPPADPPPLPPPPLPGRTPPEPEFVIGDGGVAVARPTASRAAWIVAIAVVVVLGAGGAAAWFVARTGGPELRSLDAVPAGAVAAMAINTDLSSQGWIEAGAAFQRLGLGSPEDALRNLLENEDLDFQADVAPFLGGDMTVALLDVPGYLAGFPLDPVQVLVAGVDVEPTSGMELEDDTEPVVVAILRPADIVAAEAAATRLAAESPEPSPFETVGEYIVVGTTADAVAAARAVIEDTAPGLTDGEHVAAVVDGLPRNAVSVIVTAPGNLPPEAFPTVNPDPACDPTAQLRESAVGAALTIDGDGFHLEGIVSGPAEAEPSDESRLLAQLPAGVEVVLRGTGIGSRLAQSVGCLDPEIRAGLEEGLAGADLTLDQVVGAIGDEVAVAVDTSALAGGEGLPQFLALLELTDPAVARQALEAAATGFAGSGALEETPNGYRFTEFGSGVSVLAEVRENTLVVASGIEAVTSGASIADDPRLPEGAATDNFLAWVDLPAIVNLIYAQIGTEPATTWVAELESWIGESMGDAFRLEVTLTPEEA